MDLGEWLAPTSEVVFGLAGDDVTVAELLGFVTGAWCVWLTVRERIGNFPVGIANSAFLLLLFFDARLYANAVLQVVYIALGVAGWWLWLRGGSQRTRLALARATRAETLALTAWVVAGTALLTYVLRAADAAAPFWDGLTTALSIAAQWLLNRKRVESWYVWIAVDVIYVPLYVSQGLHLTAAVYLLMLGMCVAGLRAWREAYVPPRAAEPVGVAA